MNAQRSTEIQAVLEGVTLPATRAELLAYARAQDGDIVRDLAQLPDEEFDRLDAVGAWLTMELSPPKPPEQASPHEESGQPPGGDDYVTPHPKDTGKVRRDAPRTNPPQKAIEKASKTLKRQQAQQGS